MNVWVLREVVLDHVELEDLAVGAEVRQSQPTSTHILIAPEDFYDRRALTLVDESQNGLYLLPCLFDVDRSFDSQPRSNNEIEEQLRAFSGVGVVVV